MSHCSKTIILVVVFIFCSHISFAQVKLGVKGGVGVSGLHRSPDHFTSALRPAYHAGLFTQITRYKSRFFVRPELLYSVRGFYMNTQGVNRLVTLNYFSIPIMFGFNPLKKLSLLAGIEPSFMTGFTTPFYNNYRTNDISVNAGIGYDITYNLGLELRGGAGLLSLMEVQKTDEQGRQTSTNAGYNYALQVTLSYNLAKEGLSNIAPVLRNKKN
jgi:hypothetical protein